MASVDSAITPPKTHPGRAESTASPPFDTQPFTEIALAAEFLTDIERTRIASMNRVDALGRLGIADGPEIAAARSMTTSLEALEKEAIKMLRASTRKVAWLEDWLRATVGVGDKQGGRMIGVIGHPRWRYDNANGVWLPRTVGQLWAYSGFHVVSGHTASDIQTCGAGSNGNAGDQQVNETQPALVPGVAPSHRRGVQSNWNDDARMRMRLIAESCMKARSSPFREVYEDGRSKYAEALHQVECRRCGPSGKPAKVGTPLSDGHKHARALRLVSKAVLKDYWIAAEPT